MKKALALALVLSVVGFSCSPGTTEGTKLAEGTPAYQLAKDLSAVLPLFDPDKNTVLYEAKKFTVTAGDVAEVILNTMGNAAFQLIDRDPAGLKAAVLQAAEQIGERRLLTAAAEAAGITFSQEEFDKVLAEQYAKAGGEEAFLEMLKSNKVDPESFKRMMREEQMIGKFLEADVFQKITVGEEELRQAYAADKTATVRHILLMTQGKLESEIPEIRKKMEDLLARARKGEDFAALAREYTEDPGSKENGGLYEDFPRGMMVKPFEDAAFSVPVGELSGVIETKYGFHILKVENRMKETEPFEAVRTRLEDNLKLAKRAGVYENFVAGLKSKAGFVEVKS